MGFTAAIAATAVAAGASAYSSSAQSSAMAGAQTQNWANIQSENAADRQYFLQSRGSKGNAILPLYMTNPGGSPFESTLGENTVGLYNAAGGNLSPAQQIALYQGLATQFQPMLNESNATAQGIFNGDITSQEMSNEAPVAAARQAGVASQKEASLEGLQQTLNQIKSIQAGQGFSGDSFGNNLLTDNAIRTTNTNNAALQSAADIQTAQEKQGIQETGIQRKLGNLGLPGQTFSANAAYTNAPANAALGQEQNRQSLLNFFRITPTAFSEMGPPAVQPIAGGAQIGGQAVAALASGLGNYAASGGNNASPWVPYGNPSGGTTPNLGGVSPYPMNVGGGAANPGMVDPNAVGASQAFYADEDLG